MKSPWFRPPFFCEKKKKKNFSPGNRLASNISILCCSKIPQSWLSRSVVDWHGFHAAVFRCFVRPILQRLQRIRSADRNCVDILGFPKMAVPNNHGFSYTKNDHFGVFWGYHHFRKHPYNSGPKTKTTCLPPESHDAWKIMIVYFRNGPFFQGTS